MKVTQRIPTATYAYIEFEQEYASAEEALTHNALLVSTFTEPGLGEREWAQLRNKMFRTGEFDPNTEGLSRLQRFFINECKLAIRSLNKESEPVIN